MLELVLAGGWPMIPLLMLSAVALAIIVERFWTLRRAQVLPAGLGRDRLRFGPEGASGIRKRSVVRVVASPSDARRIRGCVGSPGWICARVMLRSVQQA